jgi:hypothetical protein
MSWMTVLLLLVIAVLLWKLLRKPGVYIIADRPPIQNGELTKDEIATPVDKHKKVEALEMRVGGYGGEELVHDKKNKKAQILIPLNLSEEDKQLLRDFYDYDK